MDALIQFNKSRWEALAQANIEYSRPWLDLDAASARRRVDPLGLIGEMHGKDVLPFDSE
ncbi:MAG: hypothetical protein JW934_11160 [Anaerolineae bacterium]|nr:hypothetical protein [Anaerolineae bacterium]